MTQNTLNNLSDKPMRTIRGKDFSLTLPDEKAYANIQNMADLEAYYQALPISLKDHPARSVRTDEKVLVKRYARRRFLSKYYGGGAKRSVENYQFAKAVGIPTPEVLFHGFYYEKGVRVSYVGFEYVKRQTLRKYAETVSEEALKSVVEKVFDLIFRLSAYRKKHGDMHTNNILVDENGEVMLIDLDTMSTCFRRKNDIFLREAAAMIDSWYSNTPVRNIFINEALLYIPLNDLRKSIRRHIIKRRSRRTRRYQDFTGTFNSKENRAYKTWFERGIYHPSIKDPDPRLELLPVASYAQAEEAFRRSTPETRRTPTLIQRNRGLFHCMTHYGHKNFVDMFCGLFSRSRPLDQWVTVYVLKYIGIRAEHMLGFFEKRFFGLPLKSYAVYEDLGGVPIETYLKTANTKFQAKAAQVIMHHMVLFQTHKFRHDNTPKKWVISQNDRLHLTGVRRLVYIPIFHEWLSNEQQALKQVVDLFKPYPAAYKIVEESLELHWPKLFHKLIL